MKGIFPPGPIGFEVQGIGFEESNPMIVAVIAVQYKNRPFLQVCKFIRKEDSWFFGIYKGNAEEQEMLKKIWREEYRKRFEREYP